VSIFHSLEPEPPEREIPEPEPKEAWVDPVIRRAKIKELNAKGGRKGGPARAAKLSAERRSEIARLAANARWGR
jgi:hypothetical protein